MVRVDVWTVVGCVAGAFIVSWIFDVEVLFLLAIVLVSIGALVIGAILGGLVLSERLTAQTAEKPGWRDSRAAASRHSTAL
jgi:hypothetical protein